MNLNLKDIIGSKPLFKKLPRTKAVLSYINGINEFPLEKFLEQKPKSFCIAKYPNGILITDKAGRLRYGINYEDLKDVKFKKNENFYEMTIVTINDRPIIFSFMNKDKWPVFSFIKTMGLTLTNDPRDKEESRNEILCLKEEFEVDYFTDRTYSQYLQSTIKKDVLFEITPNLIRYGSKEFDIKTAKGFSVSIEKISHNGITRFEYGIFIFHPLENISITFSSISMFQKEGEYTSQLNQISQVLFDVISRPIVARWFEIFAKDEVIEANHFSLSKNGILLKNYIPNITIHWDEIVKYNDGSFRWPYSESVFLSISDDVRIKLDCFVEWLQEDPERLMRLMGQKYRVF